MHIYSINKCNFQYTAEEIDWYGLTYKNAIRKLQAQIRAENPIVPHKKEFRSKLIEQLKNAKISNTGSATEDKLETPVNLE